MHSFRTAAAFFLALALIAPASVGAAMPAVALAATTPRAFSPDADGRNDVLGLKVSLGVGGLLLLTVRNFEGETVATLVDAAVDAGDKSVTWNGAAADGRILADGPYTVVATVGDTNASLKVAIWKTMPAVSRPGATVVTLDPGHGGSDQGASAQHDGMTFHEKTATLDTALKTGAMLQAAGFVVKYTRTTDVARTLGQRTAYANAVRSDILVGMHFNWLSLNRGRTESFYCGRGCYGAASSQALAQYVLDAHRSHLAPYETSTFHLTPRLGSWKAVDDYVRWTETPGMCSGTIGCHFGLLGPYSATLRPYAVRMPAVLMESLSISNPDERAIIVSPAGRTALAAAYADGIARFFATRTTWVRQDLGAAVPTFSRSYSSIIKVRVYNTSNKTIPIGSYIVVGDRSRTSSNDPDTTKGTKIGTRKLTTALKPGSSTLVSIRVFPQTSGRRTWKVDFVIAGVRLSDRRVPMLHLSTYVR